MSNIIAINNLTYKYISNQIVLKNINLNIKKGEFVCIVGENGSGKSTLIKCLLGLNPIDTGTIELKENAGYLPQKTDIQSNFPASIEEIVLSGTIINSRRRIWYTKQNKEKAHSIMKELNIYDIRKQSFRELSGGQQQRVLIARAMCSSDSLIILDEPTNGLDPNIAKQIYSILGELNKEKQLSIVMVSHDIDRALNYCTRLVEVKDGEIVYDGLPSKYGREGGND